MRISSRVNGCDLPRRSIHGFQIISIFWNLQGRRILAISSRSLSLRTRSGAGRNADYFMRAQESRSSTCQTRSYLEARTVRTNDVLITNWQSAIFLRLTGGYTGCQDLRIVASYQRLPSRGRQGASNTGQRFDAGVGTKLGTAIRRPASYDRCWTTDPTNRSRANLISRSLNNLSFRSAANCPPGQRRSPARIPGTVRSHCSRSISQSTVASSSIPSGDSKPSIRWVVRSKTSRRCFELACCR
jgi:hypothetical protein